ncbi:hypothetical protein EJD96_22070 [Herbaspirillum seropedicae]|uniref:hypothetical protein n=1 Tax=Herbaspirillum seropedicae TaxID=964 RepID=UPI001122710F|nr:hypothetical protein [Herbaspirillum seropedicae]QDD66657.1 hypothetical protein EJD96_22070 [Herbaspirillum seropedicae]
MVIKLQPQPEANLKADFAAVKATTTSSFIKDVKDMVLYKAEVNQQPDAIAYWIGRLEIEGQADMYVAYMIVRPIQSPGLKGLEVIRSWIEPNLRGQGIYSVLLKAAASEGNGAHILVSDREGMTPDAYRAWENVSGFHKKFYDVKNGLTVEESDVPANEKYTPFGQGENWWYLLIPA